MLGAGSHARASSRLGGPDESRPRRSVGMVLYPEIPDTNQIPHRSDSYAAVARA